MKLILSQHAKDRMVERGIGIGLVIEALNEPDKTERSQSDKTRFLVKKVYFNKKIQKDHLLIVVFETKRNIAYIITIIDTSKISKHF